MKNLTSPELDALGHNAYQWATDLFPINRSLTGNGVRETLAYLKNELPRLSIHSVPTGTQAGDWTIPKEWSIQSASITNSKGETIVDFEDNNLHVMGYSIPTHQTLPLEKLQQHLHSLPDQPEAIPYVTSYYREDWGFCLTHQQREQLTQDHYNIDIKSQLSDGTMNYGELIIPGATEQEILFSTYVCHPSMANNELSGPCVTTALAKVISEAKNLKYTYRFLFLPETIGAIYYLQQNISHLKNKLIAGYVVTCVGDERCYSYIPSRQGNTLADRVAKSALRDKAGDYISYSFLQRGSDERQYCSPQANLPVCSITRSKYGEYPEYHTSLDDLNLISAHGLAGSINVYLECIRRLESNCSPKSCTLGEPQLGKRGLSPTTSTKGYKHGDLLIRHVLAYCDGELDTIGLAEFLEEPYSVIQEIIEQLHHHGCISCDDQT